MRMVLPVGGLKEKILAAQRSGLQRVILPASNAHSLYELPPRCAKKWSSFW